MDLLELSTGAALARGERQPQTPARPAPRYDLEASARRWLAEERPDARIVSDLVLAKGQTIDLVAIEDGRLCGIFYWGKPDGDVPALLRLLEAARPILSEMWLLVTPQALGLLGGQMPLQVGTRVARKPDSLPALAMPATVNRVGLTDLVEALPSQSRKKLASEYATVATVVALNAAGRLSGESAFRSRVIDELALSGRPDPSKIEILRVSRPWSDSLPPVWIG